LPELVRIAFRVAEPGEHAVRVGLRVAPHGNDGGFELDDYLLEIGRAR